MDNRTTTMLANPTPFARRPQGVPSRIAPDRRRHERIAPRNGEQTLQLAEGIVVTCRVLDVSISGASVATPARPGIGTEMMVGKLRARVVRHHPQGFGVQFIDIQNPTALRRYFG